MDDGYLHIHECAWTLRGHSVPGTRCGFIQRGPGDCPYDHGEPVALVPLTATALCSDCSMPVPVDDCRAPDNRLICGECALAYIGRYAEDRLHGANRERDALTADERAKAVTAEIVWLPRGGRLAPRQRQSEGGAAVILPYEAELRIRVRYHATSQEDAINAQEHLAIVACDALGADPLAEYVEGLTHRLYAVTDPSGEEQRRG